MPNIIIENDTFIFEHGNKTAELLNFRDYTSNKGRMPMHSLDGGANITQVIIALRNSQATFSDGSDNDYFVLMLIDVLFTVQLIKTSAPMNILEIGAGSGRLSYHLATLTGLINPGSHFECLTDSAGTGDDNPVLKKLSSIDRPPRLSLTVSNYDAMNLPQDFYDVIIVNGNENFKNPYEVLRQAAKALKVDGKIICDVDNTPYLESAFKLLFDERTEYEVSPLLKVLIAEINANPSAKPPTVDIETESTALYRKLSDSIKKGADAAQIRPITAELDELASLAAAALLSDKKSELIKIKERAADYIVNGNEYYRKACMESLEKALADNSKFRIQNSE